MGLANGASTNIGEFICGVVEDYVRATGVSTARGNSNVQYESMGIGVNSTTTPSGIYSGGGMSGGAALSTVNMSAEVLFAPLTGYNYIAWLEWASGGNTTTFYGLATTTAACNSGISMVWWH